MTEHKRRRTDEEGYISCSDCPAKSFQDLKRLTYWILSTIITLSILVFGALWRTNGRISEHLINDAGVYKQVEINTAVLAKQQSLSVEQQKLFSDIYQVLGVLQERYSMKIKKE